MSRCRQFIFCIRAICRVNNQEEFMKIKHLPLLLLVCLSLQSAACGQTGNKTQSNETKTSNTTEQTKSVQSKPLEIPSGIEETDYVENPDENILFLTLNSNNQVYYQDKLLDDSSLKKVLKEYNDKHKNDSTTTQKNKTSVGDAKYFYLKADAGVPFSQILKVLKAVQESSPTSYRAKFVVQPRTEVGKFAKTPNGISVVNVDLGSPKNNNKNALPPRPNPLFLRADLAADGKITLNNQPQGKSEFPALLGSIFKERESNGVFREGMNEVEKTVTLYPAPNAKYGDVIKFIDELKVIGANPIEFGDLSNSEAILPVMVD